MSRASAADQASRAALELASQSGDASAIVAALGARQLACSAPEHRDERAAIAGRMVEMGLILRRPGVELRGRLWIIDTLWEGGDLAGIAAALGRLEWCARHAALRPGHIRQSAVTGLWSTPALVEAQLCG